MKAHKVTRRIFFRTALAGAAATTGFAGVTAQGRPERRIGTAPAYGDYLKEASQGNQALAATEDNIEGPFFRANAPFRTKLHGEGEKGVKWGVSGFVKARNGRPLREALLEVWQANAAGRYDNDDPKNPPKKDAFKLRVRLRATEKGEYSFRTIQPGRYTIGPNRYRPAHIHVKVHAKGYRSLTTQLYFEDDPYNKRDPWFKKSLLLKNVGPKKEGAARGSFTFVLPRA